MDNQSLINQHPYCEAFYWDASIEKYGTSQFSSFAKIAAIRIQNRRNWYFTLQNASTSKPSIETEQTSNITEEPAINRYEDTLEQIDIHDAPTSVIQNFHANEDNVNESDDLASLEKEYLSQIANTTLNYTLEELPENTSSNYIPEELPAIEANRKTNGKQSFSAWMSKMIEEDTDPKLKRQSIVEKFLSQEVETTKKPNFFSATTLAKASLEEHEDFITPTLAAIYEKQGNYSKAIDAYKKLALKFPEKSSYFAALILKVEQKQKKK